jgi:hypothetical protein
MAVATCAANYLEASNAAAKTETAATKTAGTRKIFFPFRPVVLR